MIKKQEIFKNVYGMIFKYQKNVKIAMKVNVGLILINLFKLLVILQ